jgi:hypothetical protein
MHAACCAQVLNDDKVARLLLLVHGALQRAACGRHRGASLGPLRALLRLLGAHVAAPHTFCYAAHILLQCLHTPCARPFVPHSGAEAHA